MTTLAIPCGFVQARCVGCDAALVVPAESAAFAVCGTCESFADAYRVPVDVGRIDGDGLVELVRIADESGNDELLDAAAAQLCQRLGIDPDDDAAETVEREQAMERLDEYAREEDGERWDGQS
jgi:hypothetical protein